MKDLLQQLKEKIIHLNEKIETILFSKKISKVRIASGVAWNLFLVFLIFSFTAFFFIGAMGVGYFASLVKDDPLISKEEMRKQIYSYEETSEIYFANEIYIGKLRTDLERREISLDSVSPTLINAVLATEDEYFREHEGIVPKAVFRGLFQDFTNSSNQTGGSTLTQQLIKNQILTNEVSYERKAREILLAFRLEHFMTKEEILEAYLNIIPYGRNSSGRNIAGIATAAEGIFGVKPSELTLPQAAYIAGIPQAPFAYTPFTQTGVIKDEKGLQPGIDRMKTVLYRMKETGYISEKEYKEAIEYNIVQDFRDPEPQAIDKYPYLTFELEKRAKEIIAKVLAEKDGIDPKRLNEENKLLEKYLILADRDVRSGGYRIYSTIDKNMYDAMQTAAENFKYYGHTFTSTTTDPETGEQITIEMPVQVGSILIENKTGRILSFVGGRDFEIEELNHATQAYRSNGSTMKPLLAYAPAIEYGVIGAGSPVVDVKFRVNGYAPGNFNPNEERGIMSARDALAVSQNLPALRLYDAILDKQPAKLLEKMDFSKLTEGDYTNLSTVLGALEIGTSVEENTNAFATFANNGQFIDAYMIDRIVDLDGNVIYKHEVEPVEVFSPETSYIVTDMMRDVLTAGTGTRARGAIKFGSDFAAKTGTSQNFHDVWFVGYNPNISLGVWMGYDKRRTLNQFNGTYLMPHIRVNLLWASLMNAAYDQNPELIGTRESFKRPPNVINASFCGISGMAPTQACAGHIRSDLFNRNVFVPSKADDVFSSSETLTVNIDGQTYLALPTTPSEFTSSGAGYGLKAEFAKKMLGRLGGDPSKLLRNTGVSVSDSVAATNTFTADDAPPSAVSVSIAGSTLSWTKSASNDVVGYRVYSVDNGQRALVTSRKSNDGYSVTVPNGSSFVVVAVDITGLESAQSNVATAADEEPVEAPPNTGPNEPMPNDGNGGGNGGNNNGDTNNPPPGNNNGGETEPPPTEGEGNTEDPLTTQ